MFFMPAAPCLSISILFGFSTFLGILTGQHRLYPAAIILS